MFCQNCGLVRTANAERCQCGYHFQTEIGRPHAGPDLDIESLESKVSPLPDTQALIEQIDQGESVARDVHTNESIFSTTEQVKQSLPDNPHFPQTTPWILKRSDRIFGMIAATLGMLIGLTISLLTYLGSSRNSMLGRMFDLESITTMIPITILAMFFWGLLICILRFWRLRSIEFVSHHSLLSDANKILSASTLEFIASQFSDESTNSSPLLRRLQSVVLQWLTAPGVQNASILLDQHAANDEETVRSGYSLVRTFVWALPVLGLIGTVIGISLAVGGFAQFLGGNVEDVSLIKKNLVGVTGGLSFAFLITLLGLVTSLILMLISASLQNREERLYAKLQDDIVNVFLPVLQKVAPEMRPSSDSGELTIWRESLKRLADSVVEIMRNESRAIIKALEDRQKSFNTQTQINTQTLIQFGENVGDAIKEAGKQTADGLMRVGKELNEQLSGFGQTIQLQKNQIESTYSSHEEHLKLALQANAEQFTEQNRTIGETNGKIAQLVEAIKAAQESQATLNLAITQLSDTGIGQLFAQYSQALVSQTEEIKKSGEAVATLAEATSSVLSSQIALQTATRQLQESNFANALTSLRQSLDTLGPILTSFRQPFVFQAVPVGGDGGGRQ